MWEIGKEEDLVVRSANCKHANRVVVDDGIPVG